MKKNTILEIMQNDIIKRFGFEDERTIKFCTICEKVNNLAVIKKTYIKLMNEKR